jgi:hypothetical protein
LVLRRSRPRFFGKTIKLDATVTTRPSGTLPNLPRSPAPLFAAAVVGWACAAVATPPTPTSVYSRRSVATAADQKPADERPAEEAARAERMLASSLAMLAQADSFSARLRQKVRVGDRVLVGTGRYVQSGRGEDQRYRFESTLTCDTETFELVEVCDGIFAWTFRHYGTDAPQLERLDVRRVREKLGQLRAPEPVTASPYLGGLQRSFGSLRQWFRFVSAEPAEIEGLPVWVVAGRWNPEWLQVILPDLAAAARRPGGITPAELPDGVPWSVRFCIGRGDMVPYRVEWLALPGPRPIAGGEPETVAVLDLQEVRIGGPVDAGAFVYRPAAEGLIDMTDAHVAGLGLMRP